MESAALFSQVGILFMLMATGFVVRKLDVIDSGTVNGLTRLLLKLTLPALIVMSMQKPFTPELLSQSWTVLAASGFYYALSFALSFTVPSLLRIPPERRGPMRFALSFSNVGFMGYPVLESLFGRDAVFLGSIYNIPFHFLAFSLGVWMLVKERNPAVKLDIKLFLSPALIATCAGFILFVASIRIPAPLSQAIDMVGSSTTPLSMIVVGALIAQTRPARFALDWRTYVTCAFRLLIVPGAMFGLLYLVGARGLLLQAPVIIAAMPVAANAPILSLAYGGEVEESSALVMISTIISLATIPLFAMLAT